MVYSLTLLNFCLTGLTMVTMDTHQDGKMKYYESSENIYIS